MTTTIYTSKTCAYCPMVKRFLDMKGVAYEVRDGMKNENMQEIMRLTGKMVFPTIKFERGNNVKVVTGYNISSIVDALEG